MQKKAVSVAPAVERSYGGQEHGERVAQRRQTFIDAGIGQFGSQGFHATTMRSLTASAGLTNRYFYESFGSLEDLLAACYGQLIQGFGEKLRAVMESAPPELEPRLRAGARCFFGQMRDPHFARITQLEILGVSERVDTLYQRAIRDFGLLIMSSISALGPLRKTSTKRELELIGISLAGAMSIAGCHWMRTRYRDSIDTVTEANLKVLLGTSLLLFEQA